MDYRVLIPITNSPELVAQKLKDIPDLSKLILVNNWDNPEVYNITLEAKDKGAEVYYCPENLGVGASWNLGLQRMKDTDSDFVIILSASAVFDKSINDFIDLITKEESKKNNGIYVCDPVVNLHCFAITKKGLEMGGFYDENFYPCYYEDVDMARRISLNEKYKTKVVYFNNTGIVHSFSSSNATKDKRLFDLYWEHVERYAAYYKRKWGGGISEEKFFTPFNNPNLGINDWSIEKGVPAVRGIQDVPQIYKKPYKENLL